MNDKWSYALVSEIGNGEVPEDVIIKNNPMDYNIDELTKKYWGSSLHKNFYPFSYVTGEVVYYNKEFNRLFKGHKICYFVWGFNYTDIYDIYTNEFICTVVTDDLVFISLLTNLYGVVPEYDSIVAHQVVPFDFEFLTCIEDFSLLQFDRLKPNKRPTNCTTVEYNEFRILDNSSSDYMLYVDQSLYTIAYFTICALIHGMRNGKIDLSNFSGKLFIDTDDRGCIVTLNDKVRRYNKLFTKLILKSDEFKKSYAIVHDFYCSKSKILYEVSK